MCVYIDFPLSNCCAQQLVDFLRSKFIVAQTMSSSVFRKILVTLGFPKVSLEKQKMVPRLNHFGIFNIDCYLPTRARFCPPHQQIFLPSPPPPPPCAPSRRGVSKCVPDDAFVSVASAPRRPSVFPPDYQRGKLEQMSRASS